MGINNNYKRGEELCCSVLYGRGIYKHDGSTMVQDPFQIPLYGNKIDKHMSPLFVNIITGERYFAKRLTSSSGGIDNAVYKSLQKKVLHPADRDSILWPSDMVCLSEELANKCSLFVMQDYKENQTPIENNKCKLALLFPYSGYPDMDNGDKRIKDLGELSWENPKIQNFVYKILKTFDKINKDGYVYGDIHLSRFFFRMDGSLILNYSNLIYSFEDYISDDFTSICNINTGEYPFEFAEPALVCATETDKEIRMIDFNSQNYSLCAFIFYVFFGRYCYDGAALIEHHADSTPQEHFIKFKYYHKLPFIFDKKNTMNSVGLFDKEAHTVDLWDRCPDILKELFTMVLTQHYEQKNENVVNPSPYTWLKCFKELGWISRGDED
jgi:hypothetical protein